MDLSKFQWTREPQKYSILNDKGMMSFSILEALLRTRDILTGLRQKFLQM